MNRSTDKLICSEKKMMTITIDVHYEINKYQGSSYLYVESPSTENKICCGVIYDGDINEDRIKQILKSKITITGRRASLQRLLFELEIDPEPKKENWFKKLFKGKNNV